MVESSVGGSHGGSSAVLFGRDDEMSAILETLDGGESHSHNLVLHGDPGVGKTMLLNAAIAEARRRHMRVLGGAGYESEARLAYAGLHQLLVPVIDHLDRVEEFHRSVIRRVLAYEDGPAPDRLAVSSASLALLLEVSQDAPVLIAVDDAQWVDHPTRELVMFLLLRLERTDIRAIFTRRTLLASERVTPGITTLEVRPLSDRAAGELLDFLYPALSPEVRARVLRDADGNPLALAELPQAATTQTVIGLELLPGAAPLRTRLEAGYANRVRTLDHGLRHALLLTALDGDRIERSGDTSDAPGIHLWSLEELETLGLILRGSAGSGIRFRHPLVRSAIVNTASPVEIRNAHAELATRYRFEPQRRVWHLAAATVEPDEGIAAEIEAASNQISVRGGAGLAVRAMTHAARLSPARQNAARRLQLAAAFATESGQFGLAEKLLTESTALDESPTSQIAAELTAIHMLVRRDGDLIAARQLLAHLVANPASAKDPAFVEQICELLAVVANLSDDVNDWRVLARFVSGCADSPTSIVLITLEILGLTPPRSGLRERLRDVTAAAAPHEAPWMLARLCALGMRLDLTHEQRSLYSGLIAKEAGGGAITAAISGYQFASHSGVLSGEWSEAELLATRGLELAVRHDVGGSVDFFRVVLGRLAAYRGDRETVQEMSTATESWAGPRGIMLYVAGSAVNRGIIALAEGDYEAAYTEFSSVSPINRLERSSGFAASTVFDVVDAAVKSGRPDHARAHLAAADAARIADQSPRIAQLVAGARGLVGEAAEADKLFERAFSLPDGDRWPFEQARIRLAFGEHCRRTHRPGDARPHLQRAADTFLRLGATVWAERAQQELRATGVAAEASGVRRRGLDSDGADLTPQQMQVARMAARGLSNKDIGERMFLSPRTVSAHLYRVFPKLGITSRSALRDALALIDEHDDGQTTL